MYFLPGSIPNKPVKTDRPDSPSWDGYSIKGDIVEQPSGDGCSINLTVEQPS